MASLRSIERECAAAPQRRFLVCEVRMGGGLENYLKICRRSDIFPPGHVASEEEP
jgi:hypothetical protein